MLGVSKEDKYILALDKENIKFVQVKLPGREEKDKEGVSLEDIFAQLLSSTSEIRAKEVDMFYDIRKTRGLIDLTILSALLSKLSGCTCLDIENVREIKANERYSSMCKVAEERILDPSLSKLAIRFCSNVSTDSMRTIIKDIVKTKYAQEHDFYVSGEEERRQLGYSKSLSLRPSSILIGEYLLLRRQMALTYQMPNADLCRWHRAVVCS